MIFHTVFSPGSLVCEMTIIKAVFGHNYAATVDRSNLATSLLIYYRYIHKHIHIYIHTHISNKQTCGQTEDERLSAPWQI